MITKDISDVLSLQESMLVQSKSLSNLSLRWSNNKWCQVKMEDKMSACKAIPMTKVGVPRIVVLLQWEMMALIITWSKREVMEGRETMWNKRWVESLQINGLVAKLDGTLLTSKMTSIWTLETTWDGLVEEEETPQETWEDKVGVLVEAVGVDEEVVVEVTETSPREDIKMEVQVVVASVKMTTTQDSVRETKAIGPVQETKTMTGTKRQELVCNGSEDQWLSFTQLRERPWNDFEKIEI